MNKIKVLTLGIVSGLILSSVPALAEDNTSKLINSNTTIQYKNINKDTSNIENPLITNQSSVKITSSSSGLSPEYVRTGEYTFDLFSGIFHVSLGPLVFTANVKTNYIYSFTDYVGYNYITFGSPVEALQSLLCKLGYDIWVDAYFGPQTQAAVIDFQKKHGLAADGITGPNTWNTMIASAPGVYYFQIP